MSELAESVMLVPFVVTKELQDGTQCANIS
jgi:hypothetical protein